MGALPTGVRTTDRNGGDCAPRHPKELMMTTRTGDHSTAERVRIVLGENDTAYRNGLIERLAELQDIEVAGEATNGPDIVIEAWRHRPDVVLIDLALPGMTAAEATKHISRAAPGSAVCLLVGSEGDPGVSDALDAGARECIVKTATSQQIAGILHRIAGSN